MTVSDQGTLQHPGIDTRFIAYRVSDAPMRITAASPTRGWLDELPDRFGYRCLPLRIANQLGWCLLNSQGFRVRWTGARQS